MPVRDASRLVSVASAVGMLVTALCVVTLVAWGVGRPFAAAPLTRLPMKANTAVAVGLLGAGLVGAARDPAGSGRLPRVLAAAAGLIALLTLLQDVSGHAFGLDEALFRDHSPTPETRAPGRMSPVTAGALLLIALSLSTLRTPGSARRGLSPFLAALAGFLSLASLAGFTYGAEELLTFGPFNTIAPQTSIALGALAVGLLLLRTDVLPGAFLVRTDPGALLARRLLPASLVLPLLMGQVVIFFRRRDGLDPELGTALLCLSATLVTTGLVVWAASELERADVRRRAAESSGEASREQYDRLFAAIVDPVILADRDRRIVDVNGAFTSLFGWEAPHVRGRTVRHLLANEDEFAELDRQLSGEAASARVTVTCLRKDGRAFPAECSIFLMRPGEAAVPVGVVVRDLTEHHLLEEQLRHSQKMEAVGRLAGGVAHDFNNLLTVIGGFTDLVAMRLPPDDPNQEPLGEIRHASERAAKLTRQLLAFSRKQVLSPTVLDLNDVARDAKGILGRVIGEDVRLHLDLGDTLPHVLADRGQLEQVLMNLAVNARDAMPAGGVVTLATGEVVLDEGFDTSRPGLRPGRYARLSVTDTGTGMAPEVLSRLFEPFFTTKERGKGTGLGLATTYGIVKQSGGFVFVESEVGRGSTFEILLPAAGGSPDERKPEEAPAVRRGGETILLVEDEESVRRLARTALETGGYAVLDAASGEEALEVARAHRGPVDLLLTDVIMPGMNGPELALRVAPLRPGLRVLYMSGYMDDAVAKHGVLAPGIEFLPKPFTPGVLVRRVREVLDRV